MPFHATTAGGDGMYNYVVCGCFLYDRFYFSKIILQLHPFCYSVSVEMFEVGKSEGERAVILK